MGAVTGTGTDDEAEVAGARRGWGRGEAGDSAPQACNETAAPDDADRSCEEGLGGTEDDAVARDARRTLGDVWGDRAGACPRQKVPVEALAEPARTGGVVSMVGGA